MHVFGWWEETGVPGETAHHCEICSPVLQQKQYFCASLPVYCSQKADVRQGISQGLEGDEGIPPVLLNVPAWQHSTCLIMRWLPSNRLKRLFG